MKRLLFIITALLAFGAAARSQEAVAPRDSAADAGIRAAIDRQMREYPRSTLRDIYKNFFQDRFGPGHLLADTTAAGAYLRQELSEPGPFSGPLYEPTGHEGNFYRVNLSLIKDGTIPYDVFFRAFAESTLGLRPASVDDWKGEWRRISAVIDGMNMPLDNYSADKALIDSLLAQGKYVMHHSRQFEQTYRPHYRIISRPVFEAELLPLIQSKTPASRP